MRDQQASLYVRSCLQHGLLDSAEALAMLALQSLQPSASELALLGEVCLAKGEHRRALHFLQQAQQLAELHWDSAGSSSSNGSSNGGCSSGGSSGMAAAWAGGAAGPGLPAAAAAGTAAQRPQAQAQAQGEPPLHVRLLLQMADCHEQQGEESLAVAALERIPTQWRGPRVYARLGRLYRRSCMRAAAVSAYKSCLTLCPYAVEAALALADLRVPPAEIEELIGSMASPAQLTRLALEQLVQPAAAAAAAAAVVAVATAAGAGAGAGAAWGGVEEREVGGQGWRSPSPDLMAVDGGGGGSGGSPGAIAAGRQQGQGQQPAAAAAAGAAHGDATPDCRQAQQLHQQQQQQREQEQRQVVQGGAGGLVSPPAAGPPAEAPPVGAQVAGVGWKRQGLRDLLRGESAREHELLPEAAVAAAAPGRGIDVGGGPISCPVGSSSPVAVAAAFGCGSGHATPASTASPAVQLAGCEYEGGQPVPPPPAPMAPPPPARRMLRSRLDAASPSCVTQRQQEQEHQQAQVLPVLGPLGLEGSAATAAAATVVPAPAAIAGDTSCVARQVSGRSAGGVGTGQHPLPAAPQLQQEQERERGQQQGATAAAAGAALQPELQPVGPHQHQQQQQQQQEVPLSLGQAVQAAIEGGEAGSLGRRVLTEAVLLQPAAQRTLQFVQRLVGLSAALAAEDKQQSLHAAQQLLASHTRHPHALTLAALCQANHGTAAGALSLFSRARQLDPYSLAGSARHAELLCQAGDSLALAQLAYQAMEAGQAAAAQRRAEPWLVASEAKELAGDLYESVGLARKALERDPACPLVYLRVGHLLQRLEAAAGGGGGIGMGGVSAVGLAECCAAVRLQPSYRAYQAAVEAALRGRQLAEAHRLALAAHVHFPSCMACNVLLARVLARQPHRFGAQGEAQAEALLGLVMQQDPRCEEAALCLADLKLRQGQLAEAAGLLSRQLAAAPSEKLHLALGRLRLGLQQYEAAVMHFNAALGHNPHSVEAAQGIQEIESILAPPHPDSDGEDGSSGGMGMGGYEDEVAAWA